MGFSQILALLSGLLFVITLAIELFILSFFWLPAYFRENLPLLSRSYAIASERTLASCAPLLEKRFRANFWHPSILFQPIQANECAFRTKLYEPRFGLRRSFLGILRYYPEEQSLTVTFNWSWSGSLLPVLLFTLALVNRSSYLFLLGAFYIILAYVLRPYWLADEMAEAVQKYLGVAGYGPPPRVGAPTVKEGKWVGYLQWALILVLSGVLPVMVAFFLTWSPAVEKLTQLDHGVFIFSQAFSSDGAAVAFGDATGSILIEQIRDGALLHQLQGHTAAVTSLAFSPSGSYLASASDNGGINLWRLSDGVLLHRLKEERTSQGYEPAFLFSGDEQLLLTAFANRLEVAYWDTTTGSLYGTVALEGPLYESDLSTDFTRDGRLLAAGSWDGKVRVWRVEDGTLLYTIRVSEERDRVEVDFSPDGSLLATGSYKGDVRVWQASNGAPVATLAGDRLINAVNDVSFSPDGTMVAAAYIQDIIIWRVVDGKKLYTLRDQDFWPHTVVFSPDGTTVAAQGFQTVGLWQLKR